MSLQHPVPIGLTGAYEQFWAAVDDPCSVARRPEPDPATDAYEQFAAAIDA